MWWIPLAVGAGQALYGAWQTNQANKAATAAKERMANTRPSIPPSIDRMVSRAERTYTEGMPQSRQQEAVGQRTAAGVSAMREGAVSSTQYLGGVTDMYRSELAQLNQLAAEQAAFRLQASQGVQSALGQRAGYEYQNATLPYQEASQDYSMAMQAGQVGVQNIWGGVQTGLSGAMTAYGAQQQRELMRDIYGQNNPTNTPQVNPYQVRAQYGLDRVDALSRFRGYYNPPSVYNSNMRSTFSPYDITR